MKTVKLVAKAIKESEPQVKINRVVIFDSAESEKLQDKRIGIYRKYFGNFIREGTLLNNDGSIDTTMLFDATISNTKETICIAKKFHFTLPIYY